MSEVTHNHDKKSLAHEMDPSQDLNFLNRNA
jgi:hypothetical protein